MSRLKRIQPQVLHARAHTRTRARAHTHTRAHAHARGKSTQSAGFDSPFGVCTRRGTVSASGEGGGAEGGTSIDADESAVSPREQHRAHALAPAHFPVASAAVAVEVIPDSSDEVPEAEHDVRSQGEAAGEEQEYEMVVTDQLDPTFPPATAGGCFEPSEFQVRESKCAAVSPQRTPQSCHRASSGSCPTRAFTGALRMSNDLVISVPHL